ncbi:MAG: 4Fe-4S binding protein, partial [Verrucomicrobia bacterium]|nr:4Fe-4S binding protein [Verrucomicrobiota bacterium]
LTRNAGLADFDPLNTIFSPLRSPAVLTLGVTVLALSAVYRRFWCRNFCPAGAFLALINGLKLTVRWLPGIKPGRCDYGVRHARELDCLLCDRCRTNVLPRPALLPAVRAAVFYAVLAGCVVFFAPRLRTEAPVTSAPGAARAAPVQTPRARQVDMRRLQDLLDRGLLSTNEALYYRRMRDDSSREY